jgi:hypothetical protein
VSALVIRVLTTHVLMTRVCACTLAIVMLAAVPAGAQMQGPAEYGTESEAWTWPERINVLASVGDFHPAGKSELFALLDSALVPGSRALRPRLVSAELHLRMTDRLGLLLGAATGGITVGSVSQVQPEPASGDVRQQTTFDLTSLQYLGAEWRLFRWRGSGRASADRLRLMLGAGAGVAHYRLRQWGSFVDVPRRLEYQDDFRSSGHGAIGYVSAGIEVPVDPAIALHGEVRSQTGSAPMSADYSTFDRIDLGGTTLSLGVLLHWNPATGVRGR